MEIRWVRGEESEGTRGELQLPFGGSGCLSCLIRYRPAKAQSATRAGPLLGHYFSHRMIKYCDAPRLLAGFGSPVRSEGKIFRCQLPCVQEGARPPFSANCDCLIRLLSGTCEYPLEF